jgi:hypothetical protein
MVALILVLVFGIRWIGLPESGSFRASVSTYKEAALGRRHEQFI